MEDPTNHVPATGGGGRAVPADGPDAPATGRGRRPVAVLRRAARAVRSWRPRHGWWAAVGLVVAALVASLGVGVTTASVQGALGPHVTRYDVTTDSTVTIDFGPLGTLQLDSPLPLTLGVRATVQEIPSSVTELGEARTLQALSNDLQAYVSFFSGPAAAVQDVAYGLVRNALARTAVVFVVLVALWWAGRLVLGPRRREELAAGVAAHARPLTAGVVAVAVGATVLTSSVGPLDRPEPAVLSSAVFDGTPLAGARVTGRLGGVIDTYGSYAVDAWRENEEFYSSADDALVAAWQAWQDDEERLAAEAADGGDVDDATGTDATDEDPAAGAPDGGDTGADAAVPDDPALDGTSGDAPQRATGTPATTPTPTPSPEVEPVVLLVVSDLHCNVGMAPLIGTLAELSGADVVLDAGDTTMNGTSVEQYCVTSFARAVPDGVALVTSPGNHDSADTSGWYARAGATVLDGQVVDVAGVRVLGDSDPNETRVGGGGTSTSADESPAEAAERLAEVACDDGDVDLLLVHSPVVGDTTLEDGCVAAQVSGHYHRRSGPEQVGEGIRYVSASTAGATLNQPTVGPLRGTAELTVLRFDPVSRRFVDYQVVQVAPDATVTVNRPQPWPAVVDPPADDTSSVTPDGVLPGDTSGGTEGEAGVQDG